MKNIKNYLVILSSVLAASLAFFPRTVEAQLMLRVASSSVSIPSKPPPPRGTVLSPTTIDFEFENVGAGYVYELYLEGRTAALYRGTTPKFLYTPSDPLSGQVGFRLLVERLGKRSEKSDLLTLTVDPPPPTVSRPAKPTVEVLSTDSFKVKMAATAGAVYEVFIDGRTNALYRGTTPEFTYQNKDISGAVVKIRTLIEIKFVRSEKSEATTVHLPPPAELNSPKPPTLSIVGNAARAAWKLDSWAREAIVERLVRGLWTEVHAASAEQFDDSDVSPNTKEWYRISYIDANGRTSPPSAPIPVKVPVLQRSGPLIDHRGLFTEAAAATKVPSSVLKAVAWEATRWGTKPNSNNRVGIMGLPERFVDETASLLKGEWADYKNQSLTDLKALLRANGSQSDRAGIRGVASLFEQLANDPKILDADEPKDTIESYYFVLAEFGSPDVREPHYGNYLYRIINLFADGVKDPYVVNQTIVPRIPLSMPPHIGWTKATAAEIANGAIEDDDHRLKPSTPEGYVRFTYPFHLVKHMRILHEDLGTPRIVGTTEEMQLFSPIRRGFHGDSDFINAVFDRSIDPLNLFIGNAYRTDGYVMAWTGELAHIDFGRYLSTGGYMQASKASFILNHNYTGSGLGTEFLFYDGHPGVDYRTADSDGNPASGISIYACFSGKLTLENDKWNTGIITSEDYPDYRVVYLHCNWVAEHNSNVVVGQHIALSGKAGLGVNGGVHLHFELQKKCGTLGWLPVDPFPLQFGSRFTRAINDGVWNEPDRTPENIFRLHERWFIPGKDIPIQVSGSGTVIDTFSSGNQLLSVSSQSDVVSIDAETSRALVDLELSPDGQSSYVVQIPSDHQGDLKLKGLSLSLDGASQVIHSIIMDATHVPADVSKDKHLSLAETISFITNYKHGGLLADGKSIPLNTVIRSILLWLQANGNYKSSFEIGTVPALWEPDLAATRQTASIVRRYVANTQTADGTAVLSITPTTVKRGVLIRATLSVAPNSAVIASGYELRLPVGVTATNVSHDGNFDASANAIKWAFQNGDARTLTFDILIGPEAANSLALAGIANFNGIVDRPITGSTNLVVVDPQLPAVAWPQPTAITYGETLGTNELRATANVSGQFAYSPSLGAILPAGSHQLKVVFTPEDLSNYLTTTQIVTLEVQKRDLLVKAQNMSVRRGVTPQLKVQFVGFVNGDTVDDIQGAAALPTFGNDLAAGSYDITVAKGTLASANYQFVGFESGTLTVANKDQKIDVDTSQTYYAGQIVALPVGSNSGLQPDIQVVSSEGAKILPGTHLVEFTKAGSVIFEASHPGNDEWGATTNRYSITVGPAAVHTLVKDKLLRPDAEAGDQSASDVGIDKHLVLANRLDGKGSVTIYENVGTHEVEWRVMTNLFGSASHPWEQVTSVAIEGNTVVIGSPYSDTARPNAGRLEIWKLENDKWTLHTAYSGFENNLFLGGRVAISGDTIVASMHGYQNNIGGARVLKLSNGNWSPSATLKSSSARTFGSSTYYGVEISPDGKSIFLSGAYQNPSGVSSAGFVSVFHDAGSGYRETQLLTAGNLQSSMRFGTAIAISPDGKWLAITANGTDSGRGAVYLFRLQGTTWVRTNTILRPASTAGAAVGALAWNGDKLVVSAPGVNMVYRYQLHSNGDFDLLDTYIPEDGKPGDQFGISLDATPTQIAIGAPTHDVEDKSNAGAAWVIGTGHEMRIHDAVAFNGLRGYVTVEADFPTPVQAANLSVRIPDGFSNIELIIGPGLPADTVVQPPRFGEDGKTASTAIFSIDGIPAGKHVIFILSFDVEPGLLGEHLIEWADLHAGLRLFDENGFEIPNTRWRAGKVSIGNRKPSVLDSEVVVPEDTNDWQPSVLVGATDPDGQTVLISQTNLFTETYNWHVQVTPTGEVRINANAPSAQSAGAGEELIDSVKIPVTDGIRSTNTDGTIGTTGTNLLTLKVTVLGRNDAPTLEALEFEVQENSVLRTTSPNPPWPIQDRDANDTHIFELPESTTRLGATVELTEDKRNIIFTATSPAIDALSTNIVALDSFSIVVVDSSLARFTNTATVLVRGKNDLPVLPGGVLDIGQVAENALLSVSKESILANVLEIDLNDTLTLASIATRSSSNAEIINSGDTIKIVPANELTEIRILAPSEIMTNTIAATVSDGYSSIDITLRFTILGVDTWLGDVYPAGGGDNRVTSADVATIGRYNLYPEEIPLGDFQRVDIQGNRVADGGDFLLSAKMAAGTIALRVPTGPTAPSPGGLVAASTLGHAASRVSVQTSPVANGQVSVRLKPNGSVDVWALKTGIDYDRSKLQFLTASASGLIQVRNDEAGKLALVTAGDRSLSTPGSGVTLKFKVLDENTKSASFRFVDYPNQRSIHGIDGQMLPANWSSGSIPLVHMGDVKISRTKDGAFVEGVDTRARHQYQLMGSADGKIWTQINEGVAGDDGRIGFHVELVGEMMWFRLVGGQSNQQTPDQ